MYFNYTTYLPSSWWERRSFLHAWWRLYAGDRQWAPPVYTALSRLVRAADNPLSAPAHPDALHGSAAAARQRQRLRYQYHDERTRGGCDDVRGGGECHAYPDRSAPRGRRRLPGAAALRQRRGDARAAAGQGVRAGGGTRLQPAARPHRHPARLESGALVNHYNRRPPWHTPYNPPYMGELLASIMEPWLETELYTLEVPPDPSPAPRRLRSSRWRWRAWQATCCRCLWQVPAWTQHFLTTTGSKQQP